LTLSSFANGGGPASRLYSHHSQIKTTTFKTCHPSRSGGSASSYPAAMPREHHYYVYILSSRSRTLYIGVTNNLSARVREHREGKGNSFTKRYAIHRLVYFQRFKYINNAIAREKFLKHFTREEKLALITESNPTWEDFAAEMLP
jgi:putative endonuclease